MSLYWIVLVVVGCSLRCDGGGSNNGYLLAYLYTGLFVILNKDAGRGKELCF